MVTRLDSLSFKLKLLLPLALSILLLTVVYYWLYSRLLQETTHGNATTTFQVAQSTYNTYIKSEATTLFEPMEFIVRDVKIQDALLSQNVELLASLATPIYRRLQQHNNVSHFYFIRPDRTVLLRIHQPARRDDLVDRHTLIEAEKTGRPSFGVELGPLGTFTLRVVFPCVVNGKLIGYVELGKEVNYLIHDLEQTFHLKSVVLLDKHFLSQEGWMAGRATFHPNSKWSNLPNHVLVMESIPLGNRITELLPHLGDENSHAFHNFEIGGLYYHISSVPLMDVGKGQIGTALLFKDITQERREVRRDSMKLAVGFVIIGGGVFLFYFIILNRTERKLTNEIQARAQNLRDLEEANCRLKKAQRISQLGDWVYTIASKKLNWSEEAQAIFDVSTPITPLEEFFDHVHPDDRSTIEHSVLSAINSGVMHNLTYRIRLANGKEKYIEHHLEVGHDASGAPLTLTWTGLDVTEQKIAERQLKELTQTLEKQVSEEVQKSREKDMLLIQQSRLAAMGEMVSNIAHQWRQPLSALGLIIQNIEFDFEDNELTKDALKSYVSDATRDIQQMSGTIDDFRNFFLPNKGKQGFHVREQVKSAIKLVNQSFIHNGIETIYDKCDESCVAFGFHNEFTQVVLNILNNAKDAIVAKGVSGKVHIRGENGENAVTISIRDNGGGIPEEILSKVFDPYFSTKDKGTGIGLYMSKMIMDQMGGDIIIRNIEGGTEVLITLPLAANAAG